MPTGTAFRKLWAASAASNLGDGIGLVAVPLLAATLTRDPLLVSTIAAVGFLPYLLVAAPLGVLVDRVPRRRAMVLANLARVAMLAGLVALVVSDAVTIWWLLIAAVLLATAECAFDLAAETALPDVVVAEELDGANSRLQSTMYVSNMFLGGPVGAGLFALAAAAPFGAQLLGHLAAAGVIVGLPASPPEVDRPVAPAGPQRRRIGSELREGVAWLVGHRSIRGLAVATAVIAFGQQAAQAITVLYVLETLGGSDLWFGFLTMAAAVGAIVGSTAAPSLAARFGRSGAMVIAAVGLPLTMVGLGLAPGVVVAAVVVPVFSAAIGVWNVLSVSLRQALVPAPLAGRVFGVWRTLVMGALPLGAWAGGAIATHWGLRAPWLAGAALCALGAMTAVRVLQPAASGSSASVLYCEVAFQSKNPSPPAS